MDFSFSGAGFMAALLTVNQTLNASSYHYITSGCYYFGVVDCLSKYIPRERINRVSGTSAGSLSAAYFLLNLPLSNCLREIIELTESVRKRPLGVFDRSNQIVDLLPKLLDRIFPEDAHKKVSGKLFVCMTRMKDMKKVLVSEFDSKKDLVDALNCSCYIPVWSGNRTPCYKGVKHIDGGFSDGLPAFDEHTIRICCFSGPSDISPYDKVRAELLQLNIIGMPLNINLANLRRARKALWPPTISNILQMLESGYHDTKDFILTNDLIQCDDCYGKTDLRDSLLHERTINLTLTPNASPVVSRSGSFNQFSPARRKTIQAENSLLVVPDRFVQYQNPSCPPSPNLNRHCGECLKMRQEARLDQVDENLLAEAEKWRNEEGSRNKSVSSPFRWVNILRRKTLYKL